MAVGKDIADLAQLLKTERKALRKAKKNADIDSLASTKVSETQHEDDNVRFADLFRPWTELAPPSDEDRALFLKAVADAAPLATPTRATRTKVLPSAYPRHSKADEAAALEASQLAIHPSPMSWDIGADIEDEQSFLRAGVNPDLLRKLRRGQWTIQAELDLHHHTQDEAHEAMAEFIRAARVAEWRCVRIIHGKGLSSHMKIPVLRNKVRRWLQQKDEVLAYCEPRPNGGGSGAVLVLLRGTK
ncbi:MAG: Smr/MutS family protein [Casimicrobium sp.]